MNVLFPSKKQGIDVPPFLPQKTGLDRFISSFRKWRFLPFLIGVLGGCDQTPEVKQEVVSVDTVKDLVYTVQSGDTLSAIARHYHLSIEQIQSANDLKGTKIYPQQNLKIPFSSREKRSISVFPLDQKGKPNTYVAFINGEWKESVTDLEEGRQFFPQQTWGHHPQWDEAHLKGRLWVYPEDSEFAGQEAVLEDVQYIILHSTIGERELVLKEKNAHFVVGKDGTIYAVVPLDSVTPSNQKCAPHAGKSYWNSTPHLNRHSVGIEVEAHTGEFWTDAQYQSVRSLVHWLGGYFKLQKFAVLRHSQIAFDDEGRGRKSDPIDPSSFFWKQLGLPDNDRLLDFAVLSGKVPFSPDRYNAVENGYNYSYFGAPAGLDAAQFFLKSDDR